jgi:hypothetical protein
MKFIIESKIYDTDTEKSEKIIEYRKLYKVGNFLGRDMFCRYETSLYKTKKGNWFEVARRNSDEYNASKLTEEDVKQVFKALDEVDLYNKYFGELEEA